MRPGVKCLITMDDIRDVLESDTWKVWQIMLGREEHARLMERDEMMNKKEVYREKPDLVRAAKDKLCVLYLWKR